ncbi:MAG: UDP-2,4-diacetamido-2,4,6-trideoxy-beta-L-altropyranose hydrolase [Lachnotalea sp.]
MIGIRADANEIIATGHVMRCIAIAQQLKQLKQEFVFIVADQFTTKFLSKRGYNSICLNTSWENKDSEIEVIVKCIKDNAIEKLIVDSYQVTRFYLENLQKHTKVIYIDDLNKFEYPVDMLINYALIVDGNKYKYLNKNVLQLLGGEYTPLREEFQNNKIKIKNSVLNVLITTGGSDHLCIIEKLVKKIIDAKIYRNIKFHIVVGAFFYNVKELEELTEKNKNIILYQHITNMAEIMVLCDVAISAGGTTLAELSSCGLPTICFAVADNQLDGVQMYANREIMISVGDIRKNIVQSINEILEWLAKLMKDKALREKLSQKEKECIDGNGAKRIAEKVVDL